VSWNNKSTPAFANITPVKPPIVNKKIKPKINNNGVLNIKIPPHIVANHEKILIPVGIAITIVALEK
jgi:hypothetical protein